MHLTNGAFSAWKYKGRRSYYKYINQISQFLNVSVGYLLNGVDDELSGLDADESEMLRQKKSVTSTVGLIKMVCGNQRSCTARAPMGST